MRKKSAVEHLISGVIITLCKKLTRRILRCGQQWVLSVAQASVIDDRHKTCLMTVNGELHGHSASGFVLENRSEADQILSNDPGAGKFCETFPVLISTRWKVHE